MAAAWVIDCSAAAAFLLNEEKGPEVEVLILGAVEGQTALSAPPLFWFELLNVLLMAERRHRLPRQDAVQLREDALLLPVKASSSPDAGACRRIWELGTAHTLTAYDAAYLELADRIGARLKTLDPDLLALRSVYPWIE